MILALLDYFKCITSVHSPGHQWLTSEHLTMGFWASFPDHNGICVVLPFHGFEFLTASWHQICSTGTLSPKIPLPLKSIPFQPSHHPRIRCSEPRNRVSALQRQEYETLMPKHFCVRAYSYRPCFATQKNQWLFQVSPNKNEKSKMSMWSLYLCYNVTGCRAAFTSSPAFRSSTSTLRRGSWALQQETQPLSPWKCQDILRV